MIMYAYRATFSGKNFSFSQSASLKNITYKKQVWAYKAFSDSQTIVKVNPFGRTRTSMCRFPCDPARPPPKCTATSSCVVMNATTALQVGSVGKCSPSFYQSSAVPNGWVW